MNYKERRIASVEVVNKLDSLLKPLPVPKIARYYVKRFSEIVIDYLEFQLGEIFGNTPKSIEFINDEGLQDFNFSLPRSVDKVGISAFIRAKNEEDKIADCLTSILSVFDEIIFIDNNSTDRTLEIVQDFKRSYDSEDKIKIYIYPFEMVPFGAQYSACSELSVSSFSYYSNFAISKCTFKYVCKWDADMIFCLDKIDGFRRFVNTINRSRPNVWNLYGQTVYRDNDLCYWIGKSEIYYEPRIFPLSYCHFYCNGRIFEILKSPSLNLKLNLVGLGSKRKPLLMRKGFSDIAFYELKYFDGNEFQHWSDRDLEQTPRKKKELNAFMLIESGGIESSSEYYLADSKQIFRAN